MCYQVSYLSVCACPEIFGKKRGMTQNLYLSQDRFVRHFKEHKKLQNIFCKLQKRLFNETTVANTVRSESEFKKIQKYTRFIVQILEYFSNITVQQLTDLILPIVSVDVATVIAKNGKQKQHQDYLSLTILINYSYSLSTTRQKRTLRDVRLNSTSE